MIAETLGGACRVLAGASAEWHCDPSAGGPRVYFANHASHLDFVVIWASLPGATRARVRPVAGRDYWEHGHVRRLLSRHVFHAVLIERGAPGVAGARAAVASMAAELGRGASLIVFPEGTRSRDGSIGPFKSGLYHLARLRPEAELIPVFLENMHRVLPKGEALPVPMLTRVVFGAPLQARADEGRDDFLAHAQAAVLSLGAGHDVRH
jgi:1-acyl-sn-glycerol-3-phosphate acyltransferase